MLIVYVDDIVLTGNHVWGNLVTCKSKKQPGVAHGSAESEYCALSNGISEEMWIKRPLNELRL